MSFSLVTPIDKLMIWHVNGWKKYGSMIINLTLHVHCDQLLIVSESKILESLNLSNKIKGIYKDDVLILFITKAQEVRKIKFQITANPLHCLEVLSKHFPVVCYNSKPCKNYVTPQYRNIEDVINNTLNGERDRISGSSASRLPSIYKNFVKLCLLDPTFPITIQETQNILENISKTH